MLKFLRKYSKWLLVVFGALLMVAFTAPQAIKQLGNRLSNREVATLNGASIHVMDVQQAERQHALVKERLPAQFLPVLNGDKEGLHWLMLEREAERAGLIGVAGDGAIWVEDFAPQMARRQIDSKYAQYAQQLGPEIASGLATREWNGMAPAERQAMIDRIAGFLSNPPHGASEREYHEALSVARGIYRLMTGYFESAPLSDTRAVREAAARQRQARVEAFWFDGRLAVESAPEIVGEPTDDQLGEHYERFASTPLGGGEYGIGYTLPERLRIEYLRLDRAAIEANITPDPLEVRKRYQAEAREREAGGQEMEPFGDVREKLEGRVRQEIADEVVKTAQQAFVGAMGEATRSLQSDGPYKRLPEGFANSRPSFEAIAQQMVEVVGLTPFPATEGGSVRLPEPEIVRPEEWLWPSAMLQLEGFGRAQISIGSTGAPVAQVLFAVRELRPEMGARLAIQKDLPVADIPATDPAGNVYFYTVLDVREESRPDSMDEVRQQVVDDWKALRVFERLSEQADTVGQNAAESGLTAAAVRLAESLGPGVEAPPLETVRVTPAEVTKPVTFQRQAPLVPSLNAEAFRDAVMGVFESLDPLVGIDQTPRQQRTVSVPIPGTLTLGVGTVESITPLTAETYRQQADFLDLMLRQDELLETIRTTNPFTFDAMSRRMNLKVIGRDGDESTGEGAEGD